MLPSSRFGMDIRLAVRHHQHLVAGQVRFEQAAQFFRRPFRGPAIVFTLAFQVVFLQQFAQVADQWLHFGWRGRDQGGRRGVGRRGNILLGQQFAAQHVLDGGQPAAPAQVRHEHGHQGNQHGQHGQEGKDKALGIGIAALDKAHVLHQHQAAQLLGVAHDGRFAQVHLALRQLRQRLVQAARGRRGPAADRGRKLGRLVDEFAGIVAKAQRDQAFVARGALEQFIDTGGILGGQILRQRWAQGPGEQFGAAVEVTHIPAQGNVVEQGDHDIREQSQHEGERQNETQGHSERS